MATIIDFSTREVVAETPAPRLCVQCGDPILTDGTAHPECIKAYEKYWDEREKELDRRTPAVDHYLKTWVMGDEESYNLFIISPESYRDYREKPIDEVVQIASELRPYMAEIVSTVKSSGRFYKVIAGVEYIIQDTHPF